MEALKTNELLSNETVEEQGWNDFHDRLSMPVKFVVLSDMEKQDLIDKGLFKQSKENKTAISL